MSGPPSNSDILLGDLRTDSKTHTHQLENMDVKIDKVVEQNLDDKIDRALERAADNAQGAAKAQALLGKAATKAAELLGKAANKAAELLEKGRGRE